VRLRILVYNVKGFRLGVRNAAALVAPHGPDVALIQECGPRYRLRRFAASLGMEAVSRHDFLRRSIHDAVLVRPPWRVMAHRLHRFPEDVRFYPRGVLVARLGRAGFRLWAGSMHLGLKPAVRRRNADELMSVLLGLEGPVLVGGDLNETPDGAAVRWLSERMWDSFAQAGDGPGETYSSEGPTARIDYLFVNEGIRVERAWVVRGPEAAACSDHLLLFADLRVGDDDGPALGEPVG